MLQNYVQYMECGQLPQVYTRFMDTRFVRSVSSARAVGVALPRGAEAECAAPRIKSGGKAFPPYVRCGIACQSWLCISSRRDAVRSNIVAFSPRIYNRSGIASADATSFAR